MADIDLVRLLASWALVHEMADEGWKAAVERGQDPTLAGSDDSGDVVDGISALVAREKERIKSELAATAPGGPAGAVAVTSAPDAAEVLAEVRFELAELRGRMESMQAAVDALAARTGDGG